MSWPKVRLAELCEIEVGKTPSRSEPSYWRDGTFPWLSIADMNQGRMVKFTKECVTEAGAAAARMKLVPPGTLLLSFKLSLGKVGVAHISLYTNEAIAALTNLRNDIDANFMYWALKHMDLLEGADRAAMGNTLNKAKLKELRVPLPPLPEQRSIAAILDKADALRAKRREAIAKLDQLLQSVFLEMFGDPVANPKGWTKVRMDDLMSISRGGSPRPIDRFLGGKHHWIKIGDATKGDDVYISDTKEKIISEGLSKTTHLKAGSLIFANCGVSLGFARILTIDGCIHDGWLAFKEVDPERLDQLFLLKALNSITAHFRSVAPDGTQPNLNTAIMKAFELIVPPLDLQQKFSRIVRAFRAQKLLLLKAETDSDRLFSSLQDIAFTGRL